MNRYRESNPSHYRYPHAIMLLPNLIAYVRSNFATSHIAEADKGTPFTSTLPLHWSLLSSPVPPFNLIRIAGFPVSVSSFKVKVQLDGLPSSLFPCSLSLLPSPPKPLNDCFLKRRLVSQTHPLTTACEWSS